MMNPNSMTLKPDEILEIILKHHWLLIVPFCISMMAGIFLALFQPRIYESRTVILIQPQKVPQNIVKSIVSTDINARITTLSQRIMSRTNLEKIIAEFEMFSGPRYKGLFMEDKINMLRKNISVKMTQGGGRNLDSFEIAFRGKEPEKVRRVAESLAAYIIDENLKIRETHVLGTKIFLEDELSLMRKRLTEHEKKLKEYREKYMGGLPEQLETNLKILDNLNDRMSEIQGNIREARKRLSTTGKNMEATTPVIVSQGGEGENESLETLKLTLENYLSRYTENHPDVIRLKKRIDSFERIQKDDGAERVDISKGSPNQAKLPWRRMEIVEEIKNGEEEMADLRKQMAVYKKRVEDTPRREQELLSLKRDYENIRRTYNSLLERQLEAQIAVNMEKKQKGEQFRILDPARVPEKPVEPDLKKMFILFLGTGLAIGAVLIFLVEYFDQSFKSPSDMESFLGLNVIASIPTIMHADDIKKRRWGITASVCGIVISTVLFAGFALVTIIKG